MSSVPKLHIMRRIRSLGRLLERESCDASTLVGTVLRLWCRLAFSSLPNPKLPYSSRLAKEPEINSFVDLLCQLSFLEATYWLSSSYAILADDKYRKMMAMFFTPVSITKGLLNDLEEQGIDFSNQSFMDPACGGAAFLVPIALRIREALVIQGVKPKKILNHIERRLYGTDLDQTLCVLSRHFLWMALYEEIDKTKYCPKFKIMKANSLTELNSKLGKIDVVVCNPPYRKMTTSEVEPLRGVFGDVIGAQSNLYSLFINLCTRLMRPGGYAALVTPTSFLSGQYYSRLRKYLVGSTDILHIGVVGDRIGVFIDVEQETALTVLRRHKDGSKKKAVTNVSVVSNTGQYKGVGECYLSNSGAAWPIPRSIDDLALLNIASNSQFRLVDYGYRVRIGAYVWNRDKRPKFTSYAMARTAKARHALPLLWSRDITSAGVATLQRNVSARGEARFVDLGEMGMASIVKNPSVILQRVTSNDQPRRLVAAMVSPDILSKYGGFIGENHVVIVEQAVENPALSPGNLAKLLSTSSLDRYFRCISGATNVSAFELNQLALPDPKELRDVLRKGASMEKAVKQLFGFGIRD